MKQEKDYKKKRLKIKEKKRAMKDMKFIDSNHMKAYKAELTREYRANKRSEKQLVKKKIDEELSKYNDSSS